MTNEPRAPASADANGGYVSAVRLPHESFPQPTDGNVKVWRYLDLARLISLLVNGKLPLTRVDLFADEFEGSITRGMRERVFALQDNRATLAYMQNRLRFFTYASCWHANDAESEAMWRLYCGSDSGVALQTTYRKLDESVPPDLFLGQVTYIDYDSSAPFLNGDNLLSALMHKRAAFAHEHEVRVLAWPPPELISEGDVSTLTPTVFGEAGPLIWREWDIVGTIDHVYVSPYSPAWFADVVEAVLSKFAPALVDRLKWSRMKGSPMF